MSCEYQVSQTDFFSQIQNNAQNSQPGIIGFSSFDQLQQSGSKVCALLVADPDAAGCVECDYDDQETCPIFQFYKSRIIK